VLLPSICLNIVSNLSGFTSPARRKLAFFTLYILPEEAPHAPTAM
jgi:hypothetical protein